jgi:hypothetical protein
MFIRKTLPSPFSRAVVLATAAALVLTVTVPLPVAQAATAAPAVKAVSAATETAGEATDFSAAKRKRVVRRGYRNNNAAGLAFMGLALGTVGAVIAEQRRRDYYRDNYYYGGNPYYGGRYYGGPAYYGGGYYGY